MCHALTSQVGGVLEPELGVKFHLKDLRLQSEIPFYVGHVDSTKGFYYPRRRRGRSRIGCARFWVFARLVPPEHALGGTGEGGPLHGWAAHG